MQGRMECNPPRLQQSGRPVSRQKCAAASINAASNQTLSMHLLGLGVKGAHQPSTVCFAYTGTVAGFSRSRGSPEGGLPEWTQKAFLARRPGKADDLGGRLEAERQANHSTAGEISYEPRSRTINRAHIVLPIFFSSHRTHTTWLSLLLGGDRRKQSRQYSASNCTLPPRVLVIRGQRPDSLEDPTANLDKKHKCLKRGPSKWPDRLLAPTSPTLTCPLMPRVASRPSLANAHGGGGAGKRPRRGPVRCMSPRHKDVHQSLVPSHRGKVE